jgi:hypothetical protein
MHATYNETIDRALDVFEKVNQDIPFDGLHWFFDHAETVSQKNIDRIAALGGGIAVQHRMMYQAEDFAERYGVEAMADTPPISKMLAAGVPVGAGTDATRVASYNPWVSLSWLVTGRSLGGLRMYPAAQRQDRETALRLWTEANTWFSNEEGKKGVIAEGRLADLVVLDRDYFSVAEDQIVHIESDLTLLGGKVVWGSGDFAREAPPIPPPTPDWSPVRTFGGYHSTKAPGGSAERTGFFASIAASCGCSTACGVHGHDHAATARLQAPAADAKSFWGALGCACWAV